MKQFYLAAIFLLIFSAVAACEEPLPYVSMPVSGPEQAFRYELSMVARKALELGQVRFSAVRSINDSYQLTADAIMHLVREGDKERAIAILQDATKKFKGNRLARLLLGYAFERSGHVEGAVRAYSDFYRYSLTLSPMENRLISSSSLEVFRNYVELRFRQWGEGLPEPKVSLHIHGGRSLVMLEGSRAGQWINLILPFVVVGGFVFLLTLRMEWIELPASVFYFLIRFYILVIFAYLVWLAHFFLGLPFLGSLETEFLILFAAGVLSIVVFYAVGRFRAYQEENSMEGAKRCPHCKAFILCVAQECPKCKRPCKD